MRDDGKLTVRQNNLVEMLQSDDKLMSRSGNFLTLLARRIMFDINLTTRQYYSRIELWLSRKYSKDKQSLSKLASHRNNFITEVTHDTMTPNTFQKFTESLGAKRVTISVKLEYDDGRGDHTSTITFSNRIEEDTSGD